MSNRYLDFVLKANNYKNPDSKEILCSGKNGIKKIPE